MALAGYVAVTSESSFLVAATCGTQATKVTQFSTSQSCPARPVTNAPQPHRWLRCKHNCKNINHLPFAAEHAAVQISLDYFDSTLSQYFLRIFTLSHLVLMRHHRCRTIDRTCPTSLTALYKFLFGAFLLVHDYIPF